MPRIRGDDGSDVLATQADVKTATATLSTAAYRLTVLAFNFEGVPIVTVEESECLTPAA